MPHPRPPCGRWGTRTTEANRGATLSLTKAPALFGPPPFYLMSLFRPQGHLQHCPVPLRRDPPAPPAWGPPRLARSCSVFAESPSLRTSGIFLGVELGGGVREDDHPGRAPHPSQPSGRTRLWEARLGPLAQVACRGFSAVKSLPPSVLLCGGGLLSFYLHSSRQALRCRARHPDASADFGPSGLGTRGLPLPPSPRMLQAPELCPRGWWAAPQCPGLRFLVPPPARPGVSARVWLHGSS